jgi:hypothetical protein
MTHVRITVASPLRECLLHCGVDSVHDFAPISTTVADIELVTAWARQSGPEAVALALRQLDELLPIVRQSGARELSEVLVAMEASSGGQLVAAQQALVTLLDALRSAMERHAEPCAAPDRGGQPPR